MGKTRNRKRQGAVGAGPREVNPEMHKDDVARNMMAEQPNLTPKSTTHKLQGKALKKHLWSTRLYGKKGKQREYNEEELDLPKLNSTVNIGAIKKHGKKGKKLVNDRDSILMTRLINQINDDKDKTNESKLEKSRRLEQVREMRRLEIERKEQKKKDALESAKDEIRSKASLARSVRRKQAKAKKEEETEEAAQGGKRKKKSVSFA